MASCQRQSIWSVAYFKDAQSLSCCSYAPSKFKPLRLGTMLKLKVLKLVEKNVMKMSTSPIFRKCLELTLYIYIISSFNLGESFRGSPLFSHDAQGWDLRNSVTVTRQFHCLPVPCLFK